MQYGEHWVEGVLQRKNTVGYCKEREKERERERGRERERENWLGDVHMIG